MGAKPGNKNAAGSKGGGRKSAYQEGIDAQFLIDVWTQPQRVDEIQKRLKAKFCSLSDVFLLKAFGGNDTVLLAIFNKLYPDRIDPLAAGVMGALSSVAKREIEKYTLTKPQNANSRPTKPAADIPRSNL